MHKKILTALRGSIGSALAPLARSDRFSEGSGFWDMYSVDLNEELRVDVLVTAHPSTDTFAITVTWRNGRIPQSSGLYTPKRFASEDCLNRYDVTDAPDSGSIDFGMIVHGRQIVYHFLGRFSPDAEVPIHMLYSSGDGPDYRVARIPLVVELVRQQKENCLLPFLRALQAKAGHGGMALI